MSHRSNCLHGSIERAASPSANSHTCIRSSIKPRIAPCRSNSGALKPAAAASSPARGSGVASTTWPTCRWETRKRKPSPDCWGKSSHAKARRRKVKKIHQRKTRGVCLKPSQRFNTISAPLRLCVRTSPRLATRSFKERLERHGRVVFLVAGTVNERHRPLLHFRFDRGHGFGTLTQFLRVAFAKLAPLGW